MTRKSRPALGHCKLSIERCPSQTLPSSLHVVHSTQGVKSAHKLHHHFSPEHHPHGFRGPCRQTPACSADGRRGPNLGPLWTVRKLSLKTVTSWRETFTVVWGQNRGTVPLHDDKFIRHKVWATELQSDAFQHPAMLCNIKTCACVSFSVRRDRAFLHKTDVKVMLHMCPKQTSTCLFATIRRVTKIRNAHRLTILTVPRPTNKMHSTSLLCTTHCGVETTLEGNKPCTRIHAWSMVEGRCGSSCEVHP